ncbi:MAG: hypothetical protein LPJ89_07920, partial [Hymenobacteraceae bacterium]|nr:hypothetical protein [Hymenobacteraceae bacterium]MDX5396633.1 hypothetical protein [Hymenobacteraceae bacterium]MDX5443689.1 hypothetical protein [Hymenobacteraceae bacterium]MDX5512700.1 hypothetical protein [Hymenobacteraceae bacterium]
MVKKLSLVVLLGAATALGANAQIGGKQTFRFLSVPTNAKVAAIGGVNVSSMDQDVNMLASNPALLNEKMDKHLS